MNKGVISAMNEKKRISVILPCYNEEESLPLYFKAVDPVLAEIKDYKVDFVLVNDGSKDKTLEVMNDLYMKRNDVTIVSLSRNYGQNPAFSAGLSVCKGDYAIMMDADLQDPVELLPEIARKFSEGYEVVNPHRSDRSTDSEFKKESAGFFYRFLNKLEGKEVIPENVNCFRGISRRAIDEINSLTEKDRYLLTEVPLVGFRTCCIDFKREERSAGKSKYNLKKMVKYALDNISSATSSPLYLAIKFGAFFSFFFLFSSIILTVFYFLSRYNVLLTDTLSLMTAMILSWVFFGLSVILDFIGLEDIYLHNMLINTRNRPTYVIDILKRSDDKAEENVKIDRREE